MADFDQDAVDEAIRILQPQIDALSGGTAEAVWAVKQVVHFSDGTILEYNLKQVTP